MSERSYRLALNRSSHGVIVNRPHLTGINLGPLITAEEVVIIQQEAFSAVATCMDCEGGEHGTIFNLDVLIAAFHFENEHLILRSDSQRGLLRD